MAFYRITQEALNNIVKHARATRVIVTLRLDDNVRLSIVDNGVGFDPADVPPNHLGTKDHARTRRGDRREVFVV